MVLNTPGPICYGDLKYANGVEYTTFAKEDEKRGLLALYCDDNWMA